MQTPSSASLLIDALTPAQRAVLYEALLAYKFTITELKADNENSTVAPTIQRRIGQFIDWNQQQLKEITDTLFADCFLADLETIKHFTGAVLFEKS